MRHLRGGLGVRSVLELVDCISGVGGVGRAADCVRSDAGLLAADGSWSFYVNWLLVFGADDLAAAVLRGDSVVWRLDARGGCHFTRSRLAAVASAISILWRRVRLLAHWRRHTLFFAVCEAGWE